MIAAEGVVANGEPAILALLMGRFFTREAGILILVGGVVISALGVADHLPWPLLAAVVFAWVLVAAVLSIGLTHWLVPVYLRFGFIDRAIELCLLARDSAPNRKMRDQASVDVAMIHATTGRFADALRNLERVNAFAMGTLPRALVEANRAWCRAHLNQDLEKALEEAHGAREAVPDEGIFAYIEGLVLHRLGRDAEALEAIEASLVSEPDPRLPQPGERALVLSEVRQALGDAAGARAALDDAVRQGTQGPFREAIDQARVSP